MSSTRPTFGACHERGTAPTLVEWRMTTSQGQPDAPPSGPDILAEFLTIERGSLIDPDTDAESRPDTADNLCLRILDADGEVEVIAAMNVGNSNPPGRTALVVVSSHNGGRADNVALTVSLLNVVTRVYDPIGTAAVQGGSERLSQFRTLLGRIDPHIGPRGEVRVKLSVSPGNFPPSGGRYTYAFNTVTLRLRDEGEVQSSGRDATAADPGSVGKAVVRSRLQAQPSGDCNEVQLM